MEEEKIVIEETVHTEEIQDIIGTPPRWLYRWGITVVLVIALLCILVSSAINYPEVIKTRLQILSTYQPDSIVCKDVERLTKILVRNDSWVTKGDSLALTTGATGILAIRADVSGKLSYAGIIHENEELAPGERVFVITAKNTGFYGRMIIPGNEVHKVIPGQNVLVKLRDAEEGKPGLTGIIKYVVNDPAKNGDYLAEVDFSDPKNTHTTNQLSVRNETMADAEIIIAKATLLHRLVQSLIKGTK